MSMSDLPLKLVMTRWYNSIRDWVLDDVKQMIGNTLVGGKVVGSTISGTIPSTSVPYSGATPASVAATATVGSATSGAPHADHQHAMGIVTTKGDILSYGSAPTRHAVGSDNSILTADSSKTDGLDFKQTITVSGEIQGSDFKPSGLTGATAAGGYVGNTTSGAPVSGTFSLGEWITDQTGKRWTCTVAGSPGTWTQEPGTGSGSLEVKEVDGAPDVTGVTTIIVSNGTLTDNGGGSVTITTGGGGSGAPTSDTYLLQTADATLSNAIVFPGASYWQDGSGRFGNTTAGGISEEYETTSENLTWTPSNPTNHDSNTTSKSCLFAQLTSDNTERLGLRSWSPAGAFDARCHLSLGPNATTASSGAGLMITDSTNGNRVYMDLNAFNSQSLKVTAYTYSGGGYTSRASLTVPACRYLRITRDASNNFTWFYSTDGLEWFWFANLAFTFTVAHIGYRIYMTGPSGNQIEFSSDWLRTNV